MQLVIFPPLEPAVRIALAKLKTDQIICYPTDTLYGLGGDALNRDVVKRIAQIKGREMEIPFSVIFADWKMASEYAKIDAKLEKELLKITPGPYTFLLEAKKELPAAQGMVVGCRIPENEFCTQLAGKFGRPIISTSANLHGCRQAASIEEIDENVLEQAGLVVDGGVCKYAQGSTIIDVNKGKITRKGAEFEKARKWIEKLDV